MRTAISLSLLALLFSMTAYAVPCKVDGQCGYGKRCVFKAGNVVGECDGIKDKFGNTDRAAVGSTKEAASAGNSTCYWDADCGQGGVCKRKQGQVQGMCIRQ